MLIPADSSLLPSLKKRNNLTFGDNLPPKSSRPLLGESLKVDCPLNKRSSDFILMCQPVVVMASFAPAMRWFLGKQSYNPDITEKSGAWIFKPDCFVHHWLI